MEIVAARYLLPISSEPVFQGALAIEGDRIVAVGTQKELTTQYPDAPLRKFEEHVLLPGLVNTDACLQMTLFDPEEWPESFIDWQVLGLEFRRSQSAVKRRSAILEGLQRSLAAGTTCVADMGNYQGILSLVPETGLQLHISPEVVATPAQGQETLFDQALEMVEQIQSLDSKRVRAGLAPLSAYALSRHLLKIVSQHALQSGATLKIHAAESFAEMEFFFESKGEIANNFFPSIGWTEEPPLAQRKTPVQYLDSLGMLAARPSLIGCIQLADGDIELMATTQTRAIHCPTVSRTFELGATPVKKLRQKGVPVGLGTGSLGAKTTNSLWDEMRAAMTLHSQHPRDAISPPDLLCMATQEGAQALGWESEIGSLAVGKRADFIVVQTNSRLPIEEIPASLIAETTTDRITKVYVNGVDLK